MKSEYNNPEYASIVKRLKVKLADLRKKYEVNDIPQVKPTYGQPGSKMK